MNEEVLSIGDDERPLSEWVGDEGAGAVVFDSVAGGDDTLALQVPMQRALALNLADLSAAKLYNREGVCKFAGTFITPDYKERAEEGKAVLRFVGPRYDMEMAPYEVAWAGFDAASLLATTVNMARVVFNRGQTATQAVRSVLEAAVAGDVSLDGVAVPEFGVTLPEDLRKSMSSWEALRVMLQSLASVTMRFDYESGAPKARFPRVHWDDERGEIVFIRDGPGKRHVVTRTQLVEHSVRARPELMIRQLDLVIHQGGTGGTAPRLFVERRISTQTSGPVENGARGRVALAMKFRGPVFDGGSQVTPPETVPSNLAAFYHAPFKIKWHQFDARYAAQHCSWVHRVGDEAVFHVSDDDGDVKFSGRGVVVGVSRDLLNGITVVKCGPPAHLQYVKKPDLGFVERTRVPQNEEPTFSREPDEEENDPDARSADVCQTECGYSGGVSTPP